MATGIVIFGALLLLGAVLVFLATLGGESQRYQECKEAMQTEGYRGAALEQATQFCVDVE